MTKVTATYDENSIKSLDWYHSVRDNLGMYIGAGDKEGMHHLFTEILANSIDEAVAGYGNTISIDVDTKLNKMTIQDKGRGLPFRKNASGNYAIIEVTTDLHSGGKFSGDSAYKSALGLHGLGLKVVNALSSDFIVHSIRTDGEAIIEYKSGKTSGPKIVDGKHAETGTIISFIPDATMFENSRWDSKVLQEEIQTEALLNNGISFQYHENGKLIKTFRYTNGIKDLFTIKSADKTLVTEPIFFNTNVTNDVGDSADFSFAFAYTDKGTEDDYCYVNGGYTPNGGTYLTGFKTGYTNLINKMIKTEKDDKSSGATGDIIRRGLILVMIMRANFRLEFAEQTKQTLKSPQARGLATTAIGKLELTPKQKKEIIQKIETEQRAQDAAERRREAQEKISHGGASMNRLRDLPVKLMDATDWNNAELFLCEGE